MISNATIDFEEIVETTQDLVTRVDGKGNIVYINSRSHAYFGLSPKECIGRSAFEFIHPDDRDTTTENFQKWVEKKVHQATFENRQVRRDGKITHMSWTIVFYYNEDSSLKFINSIARDISERVALEEELRNINNELFEAQEIAGAGSFRCTLEPEYAMNASETFYKIMGAQHSKNDGLSLMKFFERYIHPDDFEAFTQYRKTMLQNKVDKWQYEVRIIRDDGIIRHVAFLCKPSYDDNGNFLFGRAVVQDVTERKNAEEKILELNRTLEKRVNEEVKSNREKDSLMIQQSRFAALGEMLSMIAHQWRQPINAISSASINVNMLQEFDQLHDETLKDQMLFIQKQCQRMSGTINDFMEFFKPNKVKEPFLIKECMDTVQNMMSAQLKNKSIELQCSVEEKISLFGVKNEFEHVLLNLISNAKDALSQSEQTRKVIQVHTFEDQKGVNVMVHDNAGGIPETIMNKIFDPYFTTKETGQGTGIGLYMTRTIIERHFCGNIDVRNNDKGAEFTITVPSTECH